MHMCVSMNACVGGLLMWRLGVNLQSSSIPFHAMLWNLEPTSLAPLAGQCTPGILCLYLSRSGGACVCCQAFYIGAWGWTQFFLLTQQALYWLSHPSASCCVFARRGLSWSGDKMNRVVQTQLLAREKIKSHSPAAMSRDARGWHLPLILLWLLKEVQMTSLTGLSVPW